MGKTAFDHPSRWAPGPAVARVEDMDVTAFTALLLVLVGDRGEGAVAEPCHLRLNYLFHHKGNWSRQVYQSLVDAGLLTSARAHYREVYRLPPPLRDELCRQFSQRFLTGPHEPPAAGEEGFAVLQDLLILLARIRVSPLRVTRKGSVFRRQEARLREGMGHPSVERDADLLEWLLLFGLERGYLSQGTSTVHLTPAGLDYAERPTADMWQDFLLWSWGRLARSHVFAVVLALLAHAPEDAWLDLPSLEEELLRLSQEPFWAGVRRDVQRRLAVAAQLGLLQRREPSRARLTRLARQMLAGVPPASPETAGPVYVEGNFTVLLPKYAPPGLLFRVEECAELVRRDVVHTYVLSRASVHRALSAGRSGTEILAYLESVAGRLPDTVVQAVEDWTRNYGRTRFERAVLLRVDGEDIAARLAASRRVAGWLQEQLGPTVFLVRAQDVPDIRRALEEEGFPPLPGMAGEGDPAQEEEQEP